MSEPPISKPQLSISANVVDVLKRRIQPTTVEVRNGRIAAFHSCNRKPNTFLLPGFVDSHVHVESSMLVPAEFARAAVVHGTVATVSDPHEIGNVLGVPGVQYMLDNAQQVPFKFCFGAPACVPATCFETSGAEIDGDLVRQLLDDPRIGYLSEMMDFPGVLRNDPTVLSKIAAAHARRKPVDGHAPGLRGRDAAHYFAAGISTDHECFAKDEALDKLTAGCQIAIREGSAARNFDALVSLMDEYPDRVTLCSDDKHPDELLAGHINQLVQRAVALGLERFNVLQAACVNPVRHYGLNVGLLQQGDPADFIEVADLDSWTVLRTFIDGNVVAERGISRITTGPHAKPNHFKARPCTVDQLAVPARTNQMHLIEAFDGQLITRRKLVQPLVRDGLTIADLDRDVLKIVVVNRYADAPPALAFIRGFGLRSGAIASSVAHDSHNVIAVGTDDLSLCKAINRVIGTEGGLAVSAPDTLLSLTLPVAGLMSTNPIEMVSADYAQLDTAAKRLGSALRAPFMTLSFMALLVIPEIKLSDKGLFDGERFQYLPLFV